MDDVRLQRLARQYLRVERRRAALLETIIGTPARTPSGVWAKLDVWRVVAIEREADRLMDSVTSDTTTRGT
jgi:hypothetical protein